MACSAREPWCHLGLSTEVPRFFDVFNAIAAITLWIQKADHASRIDFWGPASNFGIPVAAVLDTQKSPDL